MKEVKEENQRLRRKNLTENQRVEEEFSVRQYIKQIIDRSMNTKEFHE
jgi:hypothetical protein